MPSYKTHGLHGLLAGGIVGGLTGRPDLTAAGLVLGGVGGLLPDGDHKDSRISTAVPPLHWVMKRLPGGHRGMSHWPVFLLIGWLGLEALSVRVGVALSLPTALVAGYAAHLVADALTQEGIALSPGGRRRLGLLPYRLRPSSEKGDVPIRVVGVVLLSLVAAWLWGLGALIAPATQPLSAFSLPALSPPPPAAVGSHAVGSSPASPASPAPAPHVTTRSGGEGGVSPLVARVIVEPYRRVDRWASYVAFNWAWIARDHLDQERPCDRRAGGVSGGCPLPLTGLLIWLDPGRWPIPAHTPPAPGSAAARMVGPLAWDKKPYATILGLRAQRGWDVARTADALTPALEGGVPTALIALLVACGLLLRRRAETRPRVVVVARDLPEGALWATEQEVMAFAGPALTPFVLGRWVPRTKGGLGAATGFDRPMKTLLTLPPSVATEGMRVTMRTGEGKSSDIKTGGAVLARRAYREGGAARCHAPSGLYWDPTGELLASLGGAYEKAGWRVIALNPAPVAGLSPHRVNPLEWYAGPAWMATYLDAWFDNGHGAVGGGASKYYSDKAKSVLAGIIVALRNAHPAQAPTMVEVTETVMDRPGEDARAHYARVEALLQRAGMEGSNGLSDWQKIGPIPDQFRNLKSEIVARLAPLQEEAVRHLLSGNDIDLTSLVTGRPGPTILFIQVPSLRQEFYAPVTSSLLVMLMDAIGAAFLRTSATGTGLFVELDEAGSGHPIYKLQTMVTTLRKFGCMIRVVLQSGRQLVFSYDENVAGTIGENLKTWETAGGVSGPDAIEVSRLCGERRLGTTTTTTTPPDAAARKRAKEGGYTAEARVVVSPEIVSREPLVSTTVLQELPRWRRLVVGSRGRPFVVEIIHPSKVKEIAAWLDLPCRALGVRTIPTAPLAPLPSPVPTQPLVPTPPPQPPPRAAPTMTGGARSTTTTRKPTAPTAPTRSPDDDW